MPLQVQRLAHFRRSGSVRTSFIKLKFQQRSPICQDPKVRIALLLWSRDVRAGFPSAPKSPALKISFMQILKISNFDAS